MNYKNIKNKMIYLILISFILFSILHVVNVKATTCVEACSAFDKAGCTVDPKPCEDFPYCTNSEVCRGDCMPLGEGFCDDGFYCYCWNEKDCPDCKCSGCAQPCRFVCRDDHDKSGITNDPNPCDGFPFCSSDNCRYNCEFIGITGDPFEGDRYCYCWDEKSCDCTKGCCKGICDNSGGCTHEPRDYYCDPDWFCNSDCECEESITPTTPVTTPTTSPTCTDECSPSGTKRCRGDRIQQCKDCDADSCLEWCTIKDCGDMGSDYTCRNNKCVDVVPPTTSIKCNDQICRDDCWYNKVVAVSFSCSDGGSGCDETNYCHDSSNSCTPNKIYSFPFNMPNGINYLRYFSEDNDGNKEATKSQELKIDTGLVDETIVSFVSVKNLGAERKPIHLSHSISPYTDKIKIDFYPNPIVPPDKNSKMTITVEYGTPVGEYTVTIKGTADGIERTTTYKLDITLTNPFIFPPPTTTTTTSTTTTAASTTSTTSTKTTIPSLSFRYVVIDGSTSGIGMVRAVGDVDGDGFNDIIAANNGAGLVWYKYPNWVKYAIKSFNWRGEDIDIIDIDKDGDLDVVGMQHDTGEVYWFENPRPSVNPTAMTNWASHKIGINGGNVKDLEIDDFNRDGKPDVVTRTAYNTSVFIQVSTTSWNRIKTLSHSTMGSNSDGLDVGDIDIDGIPDIVLNGFWYDVPSDLVNGAWTRYNIDSKWFSQSGDWRRNNAKVSVVDINNNGRVDVVIAQSELGNYPLSWYEASDPKSGPQGWTEHIIAPIGAANHSHTLQTGDMDNDGDIDVVIGKFERPDPEGAPYYIPPPYYLKVFYNKKGDGLSWTAYEIDRLGIYTGVIGDIGNDGDLDIVGARSYWKGPIEMRENLRSDNKLSLNKWTYIQIDNSMPRRIDRTSGAGYFFGVAMGDLTGDGYKDIVAHKMFYKNPGGNMQGTWSRIQFSSSWNWIDAFAIVDVDGDQYGDVIAEGEESSNNINIYWLEALNTAGTSWKRVLIGTVPETGHFWSQVYEVTQIIPGGKPEILIGGGDGVYYFRIPSNPAGGNWPRVKIIDNGYGYATGDINDDGFLDVAGAYDSVNVAWWKNPGTGAGSWPRYTIGQIIYKTADRFAIADIDRDGRKDIIVSEEVYPVTSGSRIFWFKAKPDPQSGSWTRNTVVSNACSLNSMSVADMDRDGDMDIVSGEMGNPSCQVQKRMMISENDGRGNFGSPIVVGTDKESHLGARVADLDGDGDLEIISIGWNEYQYLNLWRNDAIS